VISKQQVSPTANPKMLMNENSLLFLIPRQAIMK